MALPSDPRLARLQLFFETLTPTSAASLGTVYADDAWFKDPFNEVRGAAAIRRIFEHMFRQVDGPRFVVTRAMAEGDDAFLTWDFHFRLQARPDEAQLIRGASHIKFAADGRVAYHRDYWDAAEELYEKLPVLGGLMRFLKRRAAR
jgi:ketosteroid isomerase-like protein